MAILTRQLHRISRLTRRYCSRACSESPPEPKPLELSQVWRSVSPSVVGLLSYSSGGDTPRSSSLGTGVFVDRKLIVTTARTIGSVSTVYDSSSCSVVHNCVISRSIALTEQGQVLRTDPAAVHFAGDLAVLEVEETEGTLPPPCTVANTSVEGDNQVMALTRRDNFTELLYLPRVLKTTRPKAPWPLEEELDWIDYGVSNKNIGSPGAFKVEDYSGTPWFNFEKEVAGILSWTAADAAGDLKSYLVPPLRVKSIVDYANTKRPHDPIVMDRWIKNHTISEQNSDTISEYNVDNTIKRCVRSWLGDNTMMHIGHFSVCGVNMAL